MLPAVIGGVVHDDEVAIAATTVRALVDEQFPRLAGLPLRRSPDTGTVHVIFRIGEHHAARFPRLSDDPKTTPEGMQAAHGRVAAFAAWSTVASPEPVAVGRPGHGHPYAWSMQTWVPGRVATPTSDAGSSELAEDLAALVASLRRAPTRGATHTGGARGGWLRDHDGWVETCLSRSEGLVDVEHARDLWNRLRTSRRGGDDVMSHTDLMAGNLLVERGRLVGVLDTDGFGPADPALDVIAGWHVLDDGPRQVFRDTLGVDDDEWDRARAWAHVQALGAVWYYRETNATMHAMGTTTIQRLLRTDC